MRKHLCIALDGSDREWILDIAATVAPEVGWLKIGLEAFVAHGPRLVEEVAALGPKIFLDLKLHDIPNTVRAAVRNSANCGVSLLTVHAAGGRAMLEAAADEQRVVLNAPRLVAVTVLTSLDSEALAEIGVSATPGELVRKRAGLAYQCGIHGIVCSAVEATEVRRECGPEVFIVTPGIRPSGSSRDDQKRVMEPAEALAAGSNLLVIGRPVTRSDDPARTACEIRTTLTEP